MQENEKEKEENEEKEDEQEEQQNKERKFDNHERRYRHDVRNKRLPAPIDKIASSNALSVRDNCAARLVAEHACLEQDVSEKHKGC